MSEPREPGRMERRQADVTQPDHSHHDLTLVAALAADDLTGADLTEARALIGACASCAELHDDLRAIAAATRDLPAPARPRDFRITEEQAARLRPGGWRRFVAAFGTPRFAFARPVGLGLATVGLAGLLVTIALPGQTTILSAVGNAVGGAAERDLQGDFTQEPAVPQPESTGDPMAPAAGESATEAPGTSEPPVDVAAPTPTTDDGETGVTTDGAGSGGATDPTSGDAPAVPWIPLGSVVLMGGGIGLVLLRRAGERA